jgi:hypothetical protein
LRPVAIGDGDFDDRTSKTRQLDGVYATFAAAKGMGLDAYWLGYENDEARFGGRTARETRDSYGLRFFGSHGNLDWNWEAMLQRGRFGGDRIHAWSIATETGWRFGDTALTPHARLRANIASGDRDPNDGRLGTFNALFPKGKYFGELSPIGPYNIINGHAGLTLALRDDVSLGIAGVAYWRFTKGDGIYDIPGNLVRGPGEATARHIGEEVEAALSWQATPELELSTSLSAFAPGAFIRQTGSAHTITMVGLESNFRF